MKKIISLLLASFLACVNYLQPVTTVTTFVPFLLFFHDKFGGKIGDVLVKQ